MDTAVRLAVDLVEGCHEAGISLVYSDKRIDTPAATSDAARRVDELQYEFDCGPCLDAIREEEVVHSTDLTQDERWADWGQRTAEETGVRSMLCFRLFTDENTVGALNLYSREPDGFSAEDLDHGLALSAHAAVAVAAAMEIDHLRISRNTRTVIGQAQGILMERYDIDGNRAFDFLARVSSTSNTKLGLVARELVETRRVPASGEPG
jgi:GAF domain-containing protein